MIGDMGGRPSPAAGEGLTQDSGGALSVCPGPFWRREMAPVHCAVGAVAGTMDLLREQQRMQFRRTGFTTTGTAAAVVLAGLLGWTMVLAGTGGDGAASPTGSAPPASSVPSPAAAGVAGVAPAALGALDAAAQPDAPSDAASQTPPSPDGDGRAADSDVLQPQAPVAGEPAEPESRGGAKDPRTYEYWVFAPALLAILFAIFTRQVVPALVVGVFVGAYMMVPCLTADSPYAGMNGLVAGFRMAAETYVLGGLLKEADNFGRAKIVMFTLIIGFTVGAIARNGGTAGMVRLVTGRTTSARRGGLTAWLAGLVVFFDDYANTMIVGPTMAPVFDRLRISRAKLAYIVDSTAAPVASLAIIGTWIGAEITYIQAGIDKVTANNGPEFLVGVNGMTAFLYSLPYRFYPLLALFMVFLLAATNRDFGPMRKSQRRAGEPAGGVGPSSTSEAQDSAPPRWWLGLVPILMLVGMTIAVLVITGYRGMDWDRWNAETRWWARGGMLIHNADAYLSIFYGAIFAALTAVVLTVFARACSTKQAVDAGLDGMARMFPAIVILILAWAISDVSQDLRLGEVTSGYLQTAEFAPQWLPLAVFITAAVISFSTGTSWTTMGILCPVTVEVAVELTRGMPADMALPLFYSAVGSVLAGAIFGDHCSPISDTTVLSSIASGCSHEEHVLTQLPYAIVVALVAIGVGNVMHDVYNKPWWMSMAAGVGALLLITFVFGRRPPRRAPEPAAVPAAPVTPPGSPT